MWETLERRRTRLYVFAATGIVVLVLRAYNQAGSMDIDLLPAIREDHHPLGTGWITWRPTDRALYFPAIRRAMIVRYCLTPCS